MDFLKKDLKEGWSTWKKKIPRVIREEENPTSP
jgi:hypothetical protein